jgi:CHAT domain-containing protein/Tfp pilus assembly protein PilF
MPQTISMIVSRLLVAMLLLICAPQGYSLAIARTPFQQDQSQNTTKAAAESVFKQAQELRGQSSAASLRKAIEKYEEAVLLFRSIGDRRYESAALYNVGLAYAALGEQQKAIESYNQALTIVRAMGDRDNEATTLHNIGLVYDSLGEKQKALDYYNQALRIRGALGDRRGGAMTLNAIGSLYNSLGERQKALDYYNQALVIARALEDRIGEATILNNIGPVYSALGEKQKALELYNKALPILRTAGNRRSEAETLNNIGGLYDSLGERQKALDYYNQALVIARAVGDRSGEARYLNNIGVLYEYLGENQKALEAYNQTLPIRRAVGDRSGEAKTLSNIGSVYDSLGETQKALDYYNQALPIRRAVGDRSGEATTLDNIGSVYVDLGDKQRALDYHKQALPIRRAVGDRGGEAGTLNNIGLVYSSLGEKQKALEYYNQALAIMRAVHDRRGEATTLNNIGSLYDSLGEKQKALDYYHQALPILRAIGNRRGEADTLRNLMALWGARNPSLAVFYLKQAVNVLQQLRANIADLDKELQKTFLRTNESTYRGLADWLIPGRLPEAQQVLNLFKDQQFFDFNRVMQKPAARLTLTVHEALIADRYEQTTKRIEIVGRQLDELRLKVNEHQSSAQEAAQLGQLQAQLKTASDEFLAVLKQAEAEFAQPSAEKDKVGEIADTRELQNALRDLSQQTGQKAVAIYTLVLENKVSALLITADKITAASHPIRGEELNQKALQLWGLLQSDRYDPRPLAQELYSIVFKPIEAQLPKDTNTILWSLDGSLRYVPMAALHDGKQYLVERYNHVVFTRADNERLLRAVSPRWTGLGVGSSQAHTVELLGDKITFNALPGVTEELRVLFRQKGSPGGVLEGEVLPDASFTRATLLAALKQKRPLVHISSHFSFRPGDEARSFLLLGDGTAMTLEEMKRYTDLFAGVELLTLSACNTAAQQPGANGREIDGFAELAQRLGAGSVMATLWPVADNSTPWLMREFYQTRQNGKGLTKAEAFRRAQLALLDGTAQTKPLPEGQKGASSAVEIVITPDGKRDSAGTRGAVVVVSQKDAPPFKRDEKKPFAHPYYWAPFILIGNWK